MNVDLEEPYYKAAEINNYGGRPNSFYVYINNMNATLKSQFDYRT